MSKDPRAPEALAPSAPAPQQQSPNHAPDPQPGPLPWKVIVGVGIVLAGGAVVWATRGGGTKAAVSAAGLTLDNGVVQLSAAAPEWRYLELAVATVSAPLPPVPTPARVVVDEALSAPIYAPLAGRVEQVHVQLGQVVKTGDRLVAIRSSALPELGREVQSARAGLAVKSSMVQRVRDLVALNAVPQKDLIIAEQERRESELALGAAEGKRKSLHIGALDSSGLYWVTAARHGTVVERTALVGMEVGPDRAEALVSVADLSQVVVVADVLETETAGIAVGQKASITEAALGGATLEGTIVHVADVVDPVRRTVAVRVRVPNPSRKLRPNAFAQVTFSMGSDKRIVVPSEAVVTDDQKAVVFVKVPGIAGASRLQRRTVRAGRTRDGQTEILTGLAAGETFVAKGALLILNAVDLAR